MCELLANASRIVTKRSNSPSLAQFGFVRIMSSITLHRIRINTIHAYVCMDSGFWEFNAADLKAGPRRAVPKDQDGKRLKDRPKSSDL